MKTTSKVVLPIFGNLYVLKNIVEYKRRMGFLMVNLKAPIQKFYSNHHDLVHSHCVTNDHEYVPFVVFTIPSFPTS
jgi:hypothetical protein